MSREVNTAVNTIVLVPFEEYKKTGAQGYVRSVIKAVPVVVLRPMIGASEAVGKILEGAKNSMDPDAKLELQDKYKP
eukprot:Awhi_evm1s10295